jgi:hypothetical protein
VYNTLLLLLPLLLLLLLPAYLSAGVHATN